MCCTVVVHLHPLATVQILLYVLNDGQTFQKVTRLLL